MQVRSRLRHARNHLGAITPFDASGLAPIPIASAGLQRAHVSRSFHTKRQHSFTFLSRAASARHPVLTIRIISAR